MRFLYGIQNVEQLREAQEEADAQTARLLESCRLAPPPANRKLGAGERESLVSMLSGQIGYAKLPEPVTEYAFVSARRWRFDLAYPERMLAIEVEGGTWVNGAHSRGKHYESDCVKYNTATLLGWRILRFTTDMVKDGRALQTIEEALKESLDGK